MTDLEAIARGLSKAVEELEDNQTIGQRLYAMGDAETREWFHRQWAIWPRRADERLTTNMSLHYGGVLAYRIEHEVDPKMSRDFQANVDWFDRNAIRDHLTKEPNNEHS